MANTSSVVTGQTSKRLDSSSSSSISTTGPLAVASLLAYVRGDDLHSICLLPGCPLRAASLRAASLIEDVIKSKTANVVMLLIGIITRTVQNDCILSIILLVLPMSDVVQATNEEAGEKGEY